MRKKVAIFTNPVFEALWLYGVDTVNQKLVHKILKALCSEYQKNCGDSFGNLHLHKFDYFVFAEESISPLVAEYTPKDEASEIIEWLVDELVALGYVTKNGSEFWLTKEGFETGTKTFFKKLIDRLNRNPGLALIVSFSALLVSIAALYISYVKI